MSNTSESRGFYSKDSTNLYRISQKEANALNSWWWFILLVLF